MSRFRSGVLPNDPYRPRLHLGRHLTPDLVPPVTVDWDTKVVSWPMDANDYSGDCVWAMIGHTIQTWTANASREVIIPVESLLRGYSDVTGYSPSDPSTDNGTVIQDALNYWRKVGIVDGAGTVHKIVAFAQVRHRSVVEMEAAAALFGEVLLGMSFPSTAMEQFDLGEPWDVVPGATIEGGHAVCSARYDSATGTWWVITWGREQQVTAAFMHTYVTEAWVAISREWIEANGAAPSGLDLGGLGVVFRALTGARNPFPTPRPPEPPSFPDALVAAVQSMADDPQVTAWLKHRAPVLSDAVVARVKNVLAAPRL